MKQYIQMFKEWYRIARPNKRLWLFQFMSVTIAQVCLVFEAFYMAKVTTCVSSGNYKLAIANLIIAFVLLLTRSFSWDFDYRNTYDLIGESYIRIQKELYDKLINSSDTNFDNNSKEKIVNIMHSDVFDTSYFADMICGKYRYLVSSIICVGYVFFANKYIGLIMIALYFINMLVLNKINKKVVKAQQKVKSSVDLQYSALNDAIDSKNYVNELGIKDKMTERTLLAGSKFLKEKDGYNVALSYLDNYFYMFYRFIQFALTISMIMLLKGDVVTLTAYFVIISYIGETLSYNKEFSNLFTELKKVHVSATRINIILNFDDRKSIISGNINKGVSTGDIDFIDVYYTAQKDEFKLQNLYDVTFHIGNNECVVFKGERGSGKRSIFYLLRRMIEVNSGEIYVDKTTLREYAQNSQRENINYVLTKPYFIKDTIGANLKLVNDSDEEIERACKLVNIYDDIIKLEKGFDSPTTALSQKNQYLLSVARTLLLHSEVVIFYEFPSYLSRKDEDFIKNIINIIRLNRTIIIFTATDTCDSIADKIYKVDEGRVNLMVDNTNKTTNDTVFDALESYNKSILLPKRSKKKALNKLLKHYAKQEINKE